MPDTMSRQEIEADALQRAQTGQSAANYVPIIEGFLAKGIPIEDIRPRENVFTYNAWRAAGRQVRKGEHGVKCITFIKCKEKGRKVETEIDRPAGQAAKGGYSRPWTTTVFHISQTDEIGAKARTTAAAGGFDTDAAYEESCRQTCGL
jgi:hypothetical protein